MATPRAAVEAGKIVPHRREMKGRVFHPRHESGRGESVAFNETHGTVAGSKGETDAELESSNPGT